MSTATTHIKTDKQQARPEHSRRVPALRFNEFDGQFQLKEFDEITDITRLAGYEYSKYWKEDEEQEIIALRGYNIGKGELVLRDLGYISNALSMQLIRSRLSIGDIVYPCVGTIGNAVVIEENDKFHIQQNIAKITCNEFASPYYLVQFLTSDYGMREVYRFNASGAQPNVLVGSLRKYRINIPSLPEQQKIASFLSAVDEKIQQLTKKKALLEQYKKGVMQQLFSGQLRFKDENGNPYPDWEEKRLGDIGKIVSGLTYSPDDKNEEGVLVLRSSNVHSRQVTYTDNVYVNVAEGGFNPLEENDVLICVRNGSKRLIGKNALISGKAIGVAFGAFMTVYRSGSNLFLFHYFDTVDYKKEVHKNLGATINSINGSDLKKFKIPFPCEEEQQKIATYLSIIDTKIESVNNQITQTQTFKKGLLQQMFV